MIDQADNLTQALQLEQPKRGRGRPATGAAMTPAEKQKAYRERQAQKGNVTEYNAELLDNTQKALLAVSRRLEKQYEINKQLTEALERAEKRARLAEESNVTGITEKGYNVQFKAKGKRTWKSLGERGAATSEHTTEESAKRSIESLKRHFPDDQYRIVKVGE